MEIYIDESGGFQRPPSPRRSISCVVALIVPSLQSRNLFRRVRRLFDAWGPGEAKGRSLDEDQIASLISVLRRYDVLLEVRGMDINRQTDASTTAFREEQSRRMTKDLPPDCLESVRRSALESRAYMERMPNQLFVQAMLMVGLIDDVLRDGMLYYCQRRPEELGSFRWRVDGKDDFVTAFERLWTFILLPTLQYRSLFDPHPYLVGGDYSAFRPFEAAGLPEYVREHARRGGQTIEEDEAPKINLTKVLRDDFEFGDSEALLGLQVADVLGAAVRRAMMGRLNQTGWGQVGSLMCSQVRLTKLIPPGEKPTVDLIRDHRIVAVMQQIQKELKPLLRHN